MKVFVIAMESEAKAVFENMTDAVESVAHGKKVVVGKICGESVGVIVCGVGKVNAGIGAQYAIDALGADVIINVGVAGALNDTLKVANVYGVSHAVQYDFDLAQLNGTPVGTLNEFLEPYIALATTDLYPLKKVGTGDRFNDDRADFLLLTEVLGADIREMEVGAMAQVCHHANVPLYSFKAISDVAGSGSTTEQFLQNTARCVKALGAEIKNIVRACNG